MSVTVGLTAIKDIVSGIGSGATAVNGAFYSVARGLRIAGPALAGALVAGTQGPVVLIIFAAFILLIAFGRVFQEVFGQFSGAFSSWKGSRTAALSVADATPMAPRVVKRFIITPILVLLFGIVYMFIALFHAFWIYLPFLVVALVFVFIFTFIEVYSGYMVDFGQKHLDLVSASINTAGAYSGLAGDTFNVALPAYNAEWQNRLTSGTTIWSYVQAQTGRRLQVPSVVGIAEKLGSVVKLSATYSVAMHRIELIVLLFALDYLLPLLPYVLPELDFIVQRLMCFLMGMDNACNVREVVQYILVDKLNFIIDIINVIGDLVNPGSSIPPFEIVCDGTDLSGGAPCNTPGGFPPTCTGNLYDLTTNYGIYTHGCPVVNRVLCAVEGNASCERVNGKLIHCNSDPAIGCPHTRRALSAAGHLLNSEDLATPCYQVCANSTLYLRCADGWKDLGSCDGGKRGGPPLLFGLPLPKQKPLQRDFTGTKSVLSGLSDLSTLARIRAQLYQETGDWDAAWSHSKATDKVPLFRKVDNIVRGFLASAEPKPIKQNPRRTLTTAVSVCPDPTQQYCCSGACVAVGVACPSINSQSWSEVWCQSIADSTKAVNNFDLGAFLGGIVDCVLNYNALPDTDPFGPDAGSSSTVTYCYPMSGEVNWYFGGYVLDFKGWVNARCGGPGLASIQCECPMYWNSAFDYQHMWFVYVSLSEEAKLVNFFVILQLMISALTGQDGFFWPVGAAWYSFWVIFPVPDWWKYMFLKRKDFTTWGQEEACAILHFGSFWQVVLMIIIILIFLDVFWPLASDFVDIIPLPGSRQRKLRDQEQAAKIAQGKTV